MRRIEITRTGDTTITAQLAEMRDWLDEEGIETLGLESDRILDATVRFVARFDRQEDAERFRHRFDEAEQAVI